MDYLLGNSFLDLLWTGIPTNQRQLFAPPLPLILMSNKFVTSGHIYAVNVLIARCWRSACHVHLARPGLSGHLNNLGNRRLARSNHQPVVRSCPGIPDQLRLFLSNGVSSPFLAWHDECSIDITVLHEALAKFRT